MKKIASFSLILSIAAIQACTSNSSGNTNQSIREGTAAQNDTKPVSDLNASRTDKIKKHEKVNIDEKKFTFKENLSLQNQMKFSDFNKLDRQGAPSFNSSEKKAPEIAGKPISDMQWEPKNPNKPEQGYRWASRKGVEYEVNESFKIQIYDDADDNKNYKPTNR